MEKNIGFKKNVVCGEILCSIAVHEQGKVCSGGFWKRKERERLKLSLNIMEELVDLLNTEKDVQIPFEIWQYIETSGFFSEEGVQELSSLKNEVLWNSQLVDSSYKKINQLMKDILLTIENLISETEKLTWIINYKKIRLYREEIKELLGGLHNLPKIYVDGSGILEKRPIHLIMPEKALEYSSSYLVNTSIDLNKYHF